MGLSGYFWHDPQWPGWSECMHCRTLQAKQFLNGVPHRVFHREAEAVKWVMEQLHERGRD